MTMFPQGPSVECELVVLEGAPLWQFPTSARSGEKWACAVLRGQVAVLHPSAPAAVEAGQFLQLTADPSAALRCDQVQALVYRCPELTKLSLPTTVLPLDEVSLAVLHELFRGAVRHPAHQSSALAFVTCQMAIPDKDAESQKDPVAACLRYMQERLDEPLTLDDLANQSGLSKSRLTERFHEQHGAPPMKVLTRLRIDRARDFLVQTDMNISQIAAAVGYPELSVFSRAFSREVGDSPTGYRDNAQWLV